MAVRRKAGLVVSLAVLVALGALLATRERDGGAPAPIAVAGATSAAACDDVLAPGAALASYERVRRTLAAGRVDPPTMAALSCLVDGDLRGLDADRLYERLLTTSFRADVFHEFVAAELARRLADARRDVPERARILAWSGAFAAEGALLAHRRTGDARFLDALIAYLDGVLALRDSQQGLRDDAHGRVMPAWGDGAELEGRWIAHVTQAARITWAATEFARRVRADPGLERFAPAADRYLAAAVEALAAFDEDYRSVPGEGVSWFRRPGKDREEPTNHAHQVGRVYLNLHELTGDERYRARAQEIVRIFERGVRRDERGRVHWPYFPYFSRQPANRRDPGEHLWKASLTVPFLLEAHERGLAVSPTLLEEIAELFLGVVLVDDELRRDLRGQSLLDADDRRLEQAHGFVSWLGYASLRPEIAERIRRVVAVRRDLFSDGWFATANLARGYAFFLPPRRAGG